MSRAGRGSVAGGGCVFLRMSLLPLTPILIQGGLSLIEFREQEMAVLLQ